MVMNQWFLRPGWRLNRARIEAWGAEKGVFFVSLSSVSHVDLLQTGDNKIF